MKKKRIFAPSKKGKMPEWPIGTVSKTVVRVTVPRVRIPLFPQSEVENQQNGCTDYHGALFLCRH